jgi:hypothetical protein
MSEQYPHLVFHGIDSKIGLRVGENHEKLY